jgi:hypothetical protein
LTTLAGFHNYHANRNAYRVFVVTESQKERDHWEDLHVKGKGKAVSVTGREGP